MNMMCKNNCRYYEKVSPLEAEMRQGILSSFRVFFEHSYDLILLIDLQGYILAANPAALQAYGYSYREFLTMNIDDLQAGEKRDLINLELQAVYSKGNLFETVHHRKNGEDFPVEVNSHQVVVNAQKVLLYIVRDITERRYRLRHFTKREKIKAIGKISAILAHEIKNSITGVYGFLQLMVSRKVDAERFVQNSNLMLEELAHVNYVLNSLIVTADNKIVDLKLHSLNRIILDMLPSLQNVANSQEKSVQILLEEAPQIELDQNEIKIMINHLVKNALDSMPAGGKVTIRTRTLEHSLVLSFIDNGSGVKHEFRDKLGTPFFTTKDSGTGLGLVICNCIAMRHNAAMRIESSNSGTTVQITFELGHHIERA